jgi:Tfp pilus assembly protein PilN
MIKINLVPQDILDKEVAHQRALQASAGGVAAAILIASISGAHYWRGISLEKALKTDKSELERLQKIVAQVEELEQKAGQVRARLNVVVGLMKYRALYPRFMEDLTQTLPTGVWLTSLTTAGDQNGLTVTMGCSGVTSEDAAAALRAFESGGRFKEPVLQSGITIGGGTGTGAGGSSFSLSVKYIPTPG